MAWIEVHQSLIRHRKIYALADALGIDRMQAVGHLISLWTWALDQATSGELSSFSVIALCEGASWRKRDKQAFIDALVDAGWIDRSGPDGQEMNLHDWDDYAGRLILKRRADADRKRTVRRTSAGQSAARPADVRRNRTVPNRTVPAAAAARSVLDRAREAPERPPLLLPGDDVDGGDDDGNRPQLTVIRPAAGAAQAAAAVAVADAALPDFDVGRCSAALQDLTGRPTTTAMKRHIRAWLLAGGTTQTFVGAAEHAARHDGRSLEYVITIADRWQKEGQTDDRRRPDPAARNGASGGARFGTDAAVDAAIAAARRSTEP